MGLVNDQQDAPSALPAVQQEMDQLVPEIAVARTVAGLTQAVEDRPSRSRRVSTAPSEHKRSMEVAAILLGEHLAEECLAGSRRAKQQARPAASLDALRQFRAATVRDQSGREILDRRGYG